MPKLSAKARKKVDKAEAVSGGFEPLDPGKYVATLLSCEAKNSSAGNPMWAVQFHELFSLDGEPQPGRQFLNLMMPQEKMPEGYTPGPRSKAKTPEEAWENYQGMVNGRIKAFFEAFGYTVDSDTDEMIGDRCVLQLGVETVTQGPKKGE